MNREIKFRIWHDNQFYYKCLVGNTTNTNDKSWTCPMVWLENKKEWVNCDNGIISQHTGLKDKNGVEIYEGDLLRYSEDTSEISGIDEVFYNEEYGTFEVAINRNRSDTEVLGFYLSRLGIGTKYEVIGNIYESEVTNE